MIPILFLVFLFGFSFSGAGADESLVKPANSSSLFGVIYEASPSEVPISESPQPFGLLASESTGLEPTRESSFVGEGEAPQGWAVKVTQYVGHSHEEVLVDQHNVSPKYYLGGGRIVAHKFMEPGRVFVGQTEVQLTSEGEGKLELTLDRLKSYYSGGVPPNLGSFELLEFIFRDGYSFRVVKQGAADDDVLFLFEVFSRG